MHSSETWRNEKFCKDYLLGFCPAEMLDLSWTQSLMKAPPNGTTSRCGKMHSKEAREAFKDSARTEEYERLNTQRAYRIRGFLYARSAMYDFLSAICSDGKPGDYVAAAAIESKCNDIMAMIHRLELLRDAGQKQRFESGLEYLAGSLVRMSGQSHSSQYDILQQLNRQLLDIENKQFSDITVTVCEQKGGEAEAPCPGGEADNFSKVDVAFKNMATRM
ncbi:hypothetical protein BC829DRAFT_385443 [Chytridium lagenaria]|nr:hypothetical protein BC829DRAFT_385443 [Chytridium lagenaria]